MYGFLFGIVSILLAVTAVTNGSWLLILLWPAASFGIVCAGYLYLGAKVFGKRPSGRLAIVNQFFLFPYLIITWSCWYALRRITRQKPYHDLTENILVGRRLLSTELPEGIVHVVDLTSEFSEPQKLRSLSYFSFPILDGSIPNRELMLDWVEQVANLSGKVYIHCAEGHGRTGMFTAILLVKMGCFQTSLDAISFIQSKRPLVRLSKRQLALVNECVSSNVIRTRSKKDGTANDH